MNSPSKVFADWLVRCGIELDGEEIKGRTKWHFCFRQDGWTHTGFVQRIDADSFGGVIEVDKRYRPNGGFAMKDGHKTDNYLHVVMNRDMTEAAVMTPWSFTELDQEEPDRWAEDLGAMVFRVPRDSYAVYRMDSGLSGPLVNMIEFV